MAKFTVSRYLVVTTEVEADTAEDAQALEEMTATEVEIKSAAGYPVSFWWSDNSAWVDDENGETVWEG